MYPLFSLLDDKLKMLMMTCTMQLSANASKRQALLRAKQNTHCRPFRGACFLSIEMRACFSPLFFPRHSLKVKETGGVYCIRYGPRGRFGHTRLKSTDL
jgi:hypothetical protein